MRGRRWLLILNTGLAACLLSGCLSATPRPGPTPPRDDGPAPPVPAPPEGPGRPAVTMSDYQLGRQPPAPPAVPAPAAPVKTAQLRIPDRGPQPPPAPPEASEPRMEVQPAPPAKPDAPIVQALRAIRDHQPDEEVRGLLKQYDPATRDALLVLLRSAAQLEQGGVPSVSPLDLARWTDRLTTLTGNLRPKAQLQLEHTCFCSHIENFGQFRKMPSEHSCFHPGEEARVYVQVRNFATCRAAGGYTTTLKGRLEIYDETNRDKPVIVWDSKPKCDFSWTPRQDYFVNFRFQVPPNCPPGSYTVRITVEDWTEAAPDAKEVGACRVARSSLDFRVGGAAGRPPRAHIAEVAPAP